MLACHSKGFCFLRFVLTPKTEDSVQKRNHEVTFSCCFLKSWCCRAQQNICRRHGERAGQEWCWRSSMFEFVNEGMNCLKVNQTSEFGEVLLPKMKVFDRIVWSCFLKSCTTFKLWFFLLFFSFTKHFM